MPYQQYAKLVGSVRRLLAYQVLQSLSDLMKDPSWLLTYNLIILCAPIPKAQRRAICEHAQQHQIPLIHLQSAGFYSAFTVQLPHLFPIVDTHPDPDSTLDLRLLSPWPELSAAVKELGDLEQLNDHDHGLVPYLLILLSDLEKWKQASDDGNAPGTFKEKTRFRDLVAAGARTNLPEGSEENFDEAAAAVLKTIAPFSLRPGCREMFEMDSCKEINAESSSFWVMASALKTFHEAHGTLPVPGSLPDMKAKSADYIKLQNIYKTKARKDTAEVTESVRSTEKRLNKPKAIASDEIEAFCKTAAHVKVLEGKILPQLRLEDREPQTSERVLRELQNPDSPLPILLAFQAGSGNKAELDRLVTDDTTGDKVTDETDSKKAINTIYEETERVGGAEMHNISSLTGGLVAQEAIKILTRQYVPVNTTCVYDGIRETTLVLDL
jgi:NEDD8-activating enzyme E1 regulatory subunit